MKELVGIIKTPMKDGYIFRLPCFIRRYDVIVEWQGLYGYCEIVSIAKFRDYLKELDVREMQVLSSWLMKVLLEDFESIIY
jgi:hypothetical protein